MKNRNITCTTIALALGFVALCPMAQAVIPAPDGGYPGGNTAEGQSALLSRSTGSYNTAVGIYSLLSLTEGNFCTGVGAGTLLANTADENTATGAGALLTNTIGDNNTANGAFALFSNTQGDFNTALGDRALFANTIGDGNTAGGQLALSSNTEGGFNSTFGQGALASNTIGNDNTATGAGALFLNITGSPNTAIGFQELTDNRGTGDNFVLYNNTHGTGNTATGDFTLANNIDGNYNTAEGWAALYNSASGSANTAIGWNAGQGVTTASNVICIGKDVLGADVSDSCYIGNIHGATIDPATAAAVGVDATGKLGTVASSRRFKHDIKPMDDASEAILALKPVTFHYKSDAKSTPCFGLIAEEVAQVNRDLVLRDKKGEILTVRYDQVNAMLVNEFLKERKKDEEQQSTITQLKNNFQVASAEQQKEIELLTAQVKEQAAQIQKVSAQIEVSRSTPQVVTNKP